MPKRTHLELSRRPPASSNRFTPGVRLRRRKLRAPTKERAEFAISTIQTDVVLEQRGGALLWHIECTTRRRMYRIPLHGRCGQDPFSMWAAHRPAHVATEHRT
jgi:hypothetical protein